MRGAAAVDRVRCLSDSMCLEWLLDKSKMQAVQAEAAQLAALASKKRSEALRVQIEELKQSEAELATGLNTLGAALNAKDKTIESLEAELRRTRSTASESSEALTMKAAVVSELNTKLQGSMSRHKTLQALRRECDENAKRVRALEQQKPGGSEIPQGEADRPDRAAAVPTAEGHSAARPPRASSHPARRPRLRAAPGARLLTLTTVPRVWSATSAGGILAEASHVMPHIVANVRSGAGIGGNRWVEEGLDLDRPGALQLGKAR